MQDQDIFSRLEQENIVKCEFMGLPYQPYKVDDLGNIMLTGFEDLSPEPVKCGRPATKLLWIRICPCISGIKRLADQQNITGRFPQTSYGLFISQSLACETHHRYCVEHVYPFICPGCGIVWEEYENFVIHEQETL